LTDVDSPNDNCFSFHKCSTLVGIDGWKPPIVKLTIPKKEHGVRNEVIALLIYQPYPFLRIVRNEEEK